MEYLNIIEATSNILLELLPEKYREKYKIASKKFMDWKAIKELKHSFSENVLLSYFGELSKKIKPCSFG